MAATVDRRWYFTREQLQNSPSRKCTIDPEKELSNRQQAATLIQDMGQRLQVNQLCINTAIVYMHRFYVFHSFTKFPHDNIAAASLFLAAKVEEQPHKLEYVIKVHHACFHRGGPVLDTASDAYLQQAQELVKNESILLQTLGFEVAVDHPHTHVVKCTQMIRGQFNNPFGSPSKDLAQTSYFMATNSLHLTTFCLQYKPTVVACVCIYLVARWSQWEIMKSSDDKDWWEYVDPTVTKELLDELTNEFLKIFDACPSRLKRRILNEKLTSRRQRVKDDSHSSKSAPPSSASVSSVDSGLPSSGNSASSAGTLDASSQGDSQGTSSELDKLGLHEINMGLPMEGFGGEGEYPLAAGGYSSSAGLASDSEQGRTAGTTDQQGHPVKKSLKEYREQKERERMKAAQQQSREAALQRPSHASSRPTSGGQQQQHHPSATKGSVNSPHLDQRHRESHHGSHKHRPDDRHLPADHRRGEKLTAAHQEPAAGQAQPKSSGGRPAADHRSSSREPRPHSQHKPRDAAAAAASAGPAPIGTSAVAASHSASGTEPRYSSKNADQYNKHALQNSSDRKQQQQNPSMPAKEHKRNGVEGRDHTTNSRLSDASSRLPSTAAPHKPHGSGAQRPHHPDSLRAHGLDKVLAGEAHGKPQAAEAHRPGKPEGHHRSQRPDAMEIHKLERRRAPTPELLKLQKGQTLKHHRPEAAKLPPSERPRQPPMPPLVPVDAAARKQPQRPLVVQPAVETQKVEPPQPIDHELPRAQRPERVLVQSTDSSRLGKVSASQPYKQDTPKVPRADDLLAQRPDILKIPKTVSGAGNRGGSPIVKSPESSKSSTLGPLKSHRHEAAKPRLTEVPSSLKTDTQDSLKTEAPKMGRSEAVRTARDAHRLAGPQQLVPVKEEPKIPEMKTSSVPDHLIALTAQKAPQSHQPPRQETPRKMKIKTEPIRMQRPTPPKDAGPPIKLERQLEDKPRLQESAKLLATAMQTLETDGRDKPRVKSETREVRTPASATQAAKRKPQAPTLHIPPPKAPVHQVPMHQVPVPQAPVPDKPSVLPSQKLAPSKPRQSEPPIEKPKLPKAEPAPARKTDAQVKPPSTKPLRSVAPRTAETTKAPPASQGTPRSEKPGGNLDAKVVWESVIPHGAAPNAAGKEPGADMDSVDADIDMLINAHMAEQKNQVQEPPLILDLKSAKPAVPDRREGQPPRDGTALPKSYREKESHQRKKRSEEHRSRGSPQKHRRSGEHRKPPPEPDSIPPKPDPRSSAGDGLGDSLPHSSILTTSSGIRLKIKGLSNSMNSGGKQEASPEPGGRQTGSPSLVMKLSLSKVQGSSAPEQPPKPAADAEPAEKESGQHHHHHHHRRHHHKHRKHHHKSRHGEESGDSQRRKRSHSRSDSMSSGGRDNSPVAPASSSSPPKKRAHNRDGHPHHLKSLLPSDQSPLSLPMPPMAPAQPLGYASYDSAASTGHFSYSSSELTTVTALPSSDGFGYYPYDQSSVGHHHPPPPPPKEDLPPPPPPRPV